MTESNTFENLSLHDGSISSIEVEWEKKTCTVRLAVFLDQGKDAVDCRLIFESVSSLTVPHEAPWGDSIFVNGQRKEQPDIFVIEMQSGDQIRITAKSATLVRNNAAA